jgi:arylformamidase
MPYILTNIISKSAKGLWGEGAPYESKTIYDIHHPTETSPPVHYEAHVIKPHSLPHMDAPAHILKNGKTIDWYYRNQQLQGFYGKVTVLRLEGNRFKQHPHLSHIQVWTVTEEELKSALSNQKNKAPKRILLTVETYPEDESGSHDQNKVLILDENAAQWLIQNNPEFKMYGTSWKSTDFQPNSKERPIHKIFFEKDVTIFECLNLKEVPTGEYFWFAFPLPLENASEAPVCPVLFTEDELKEL